MLVCLVLTGALGGMSKLLALSLDQISPQSIADTPPTLIPSYNTRARAKTQRAARGTPHGSHGDSPIKNGAQQTAWPPALLLPDDDWYVAGLDIPRTHPLHACLHLGASESGQSKTPFIEIEQGHGWWASGNSSYMAQALAAAAAAEENGHRPCCLGPCSTNRSCQYSAPWAPLRRPSLSEGGGRNRPMQGQGQQQQEEEVEEAKEKRSGSIPETRTSTRPVRARSIDQVCGVCVWRSLSKPNRGSGMHKQGS